MEKNAFITPTLAVVAGHSAGHILPACTLAEAWLREHPESTSLFFSTNKALDTSIISEKHANIIYIPITLPNISFRQWWKIPSWIMQFSAASIKSYRILSRNNVTTLITTGGSIALPVCLAARLLNISIELYELNAIPGKTIKLLSFFASTISVCFPQAQKYFNNKKCVLTQYPLQPALLHKQISPQEARSLLGLHREHTTLLVLGGSQGSLFINNLIKRWLPYSSTMCTNLQIIHQTGTHDTTDWTTLYTSYTMQARVFAYYAAIHELYTAADIIICRSGAGTLFEVMQYKKKCITIPLEGLAGNHQVMNAHAIAEQHSTLVQVILQNRLKDDISSFIYALGTLIKEYNE